MSNEQNKDNDALADILEEIKEIRDDAEAKHKDSLYFAAYVLSVGVGLVGLSFLVSLISPPCRQVFNAVGFMLIGGCGAAYFFWKGKKLREEQKQKKALKGR